MFEPPRGRKRMQKVSARHRKLRRIRDNALVGGAIGIAGITVVFLCALAAALPFIILALVLRWMGVI